MRDQIDLNQMHRIAKQAIKLRRRTLIGMGAPFVFILIVMNLFGYGIGSFAWRQKVFYNAGDGWQKASLDARRLGISGLDIQASSEGDVWLYSGKKLARFDGAAWQIYRASDFGLPGVGSAIVSSPLFAVNGDDVWGVIGNGVFHFDGQRWMAHRGVLPSDQAEAIAVHAADVWVVDQSGNLSYFDGQEWTVRNLREALPDVSWGEVYPRIHLASGPDGALWLINRGLWRFDGASWQEVQIDGVPVAPATLSGVAQDRLWIEANETLIRLNMSAPDEYERYTTAEMGAPENSWIVDMAVTASVGYVATRNEILVFDGMAWQRAFAAPEAMTFDEIAVTSDGVVWAIVDPVDSTADILVAAIPMFVMMIVVTILIILSMWVWMRDESKETSRKTAVLERTDFAEPPALERKVSMPLIIGFLVISMLFLFIGWKPALAFLESQTGPALTRIWPGLPASVTSAITRSMPFFLTLSVITVSTGLLPLIQSVFIERKRLSAVVSGKTMRGVVRVSGFMISLGMGYVVFMWALATADSSFMIGLYDVLFMAWVMFRSTIGASLFFLPITPPLHRADYAKALRRAEFLRRAFPDNPTPLFLLATVNMFAGNHPEAEAQYRELLKDWQKTPGAQGVTLENLGCVLLNQRRYEEALRLFEIAIELEPERGGPYASLAEVYLHQGIEAERALELTACALEYKRRSWVSRRIDRHVLGEMWADHAWALARLGQHDKADRSLEMGFKETNQKFVAGMAGLHYRAGRTRCAQNRLEEALRYFRSAAQLDPNGNYGHLAAQAMRELEPQR